MLNVLTAEQRRKAKTRVVRFLRNTSYQCGDGVTRDFGPDYAEDTVEVFAHEADYWIAQGRAVDPADDTEEGEPEGELERMKRPQLVEVAARYGVKVLPGQSNVDVIAAIKAAAQG
jgi:hypothetical protein